MADRGFMTRPTAKRAAGVSAGRVHFAQFRLEERPTAVKIPGRDRRLDSYCRRGCCQSPVFVETLVMRLGLPDRSGRASWMIRSNSPGGFPCGRAVTALGVVEGRDPRGGVPGGIASRGGEGQHRVVASEAQGVAEGEVDGVGAGAVVMMSIPVVVSSGAVKLAVGVWLRGRWSAR